MPVPYRVKYGLSVGNAPGIPVIDTLANFRGLSLTINDRTTIDASGHFFLDVADKPPTNAGAATGTLTVNGPARLGDVIDIGDTTYKIGDNIDISGGTKSQATATFVCDGPVADGEVIVIGDERYEIDYDAVVGEGNIIIPLANKAASATAIVNVTGPGLDGETLSINGVTFALDVDGSVMSGQKRVDISSDQTASAVVTAMKIVINATPEAGVTAIDGDGDTIVLTAIVRGAIGNEIALSLSDKFPGNIQGDQTTLSNGSDATAADACAAFKVSYDTISKYDMTVTDNLDGSFTITASAGGEQDGSAGNLPVSTTCANGSWGEGVTHMTGGGDATGNELLTALKLAGAEDTLVVFGDIDQGTLPVTAKIAGTAGNEIATTTTCTNAEWDAETLEGGTDGTVGSDGEAYISGTNLYMCLDNEWYSIALTKV